MRLLIATGIYPPEIGGPAGYVKGVATELASQGHDVAVVTYGDNPELNDKYRIMGVPRTTYTVHRYWKYFLEVYRLAKKSDVIYAQGPVSEGLPATLASIFARKPLILKVVGDYAWEQAQQRSKYKVQRTTSVELLDEFVTRRHEGKIWLMEAVERWVASRAKQIIVPSKYLKTIVTKWGIPADKINVVYNSIAPLPEIPLNLPLARETSEPVNSPLVKGGGGDLSGTKIILTAVRAVPWKGGDFLCDVIKDLSEEYVLAVAGDGPELENWKRHAQEIGVADRVMWLGRLSRAELTEWYHKAHLFVLATGYEGFPHVVVEAASTGLPCVVSDKGGNPEIAELFPGLVMVAEYLNKQVWVEAINRATYNVQRATYPDTAFANARVNGQRTTDKDGLPEVLGFERMVNETLSILSSHVLRPASRVETSSTVIPAEAGIQGRDSNHDQRQRILSISLERKLFEPGKVRDRIVEQLKDFDATIIVFAKQKFDEQIAPNVRVISTNSWHKLFYVWDALVQAWKIRNTDIKVVITQDPVETGLVGAISARLCNSALAVQDHGYHFHGKYYYQESFLNHFRYWLAKWLVKRADAIRVVSQRTEDALANLGISREKIVRFPLNLITNNQLPITNNQSSIINNQLPITNHQSSIIGNTSVDVGRGTSDVGRYFLLVCRFVPIKRIDLAIHAFSLVAKQDPGVKLKIVGAGPLEGQVKQWIADFELQAGVEIIPWTDNLTELYQGAVATLITSDGEGFGMTAVESLMCYTPVIMTNVGCAGEVVKNGENGYVVPVGDVHGLSQAMLAMLQNRLPVYPPELLGSHTFKDFVDRALGNYSNNKIVHD